MFRPNLSLFAIILFFVQVPCYSDGLKIAVLNGNFAQIEHRDTEFNNLLRDVYYWLLPQAANRRLTDKGLQEVISLLVSRHNFPNAQ